MADDGLTTAHYVLGSLTDTAAATVQEHVDALEGATGDLAASWAVSALRRLPELVEVRDALREKVEEIEEDLEAFRAREETWARASREESERMVRLVVDELQVSASEVDLEGAIAAVGATWWRRHEQ